MRYFGGKQRISKKLAQFLNGNIQEDQNFYDLFCGACNVITKIDSTTKRYANDLHPSILSTMKACSEGYDFPSIVTEEEYMREKKGDMNTPIHGFMMFGCSFAGKYKGGYAKSKDRNYALNAKNSLSKKAPYLQNIVWSNKPYNQVEILPNSVIYCDIPYSNTTKYSVDFDHDEFYSWVLKQTATVFISEYSTAYNPLSLPIVWQQDSKQDMRNSSNNKNKTVEILFRHN